MISEGKSTFEHCGILKLKPVNTAEVQKLLNMYRTGERQKQVTFLQKRMINLLENDPIIHKFHHNVSFI